MTARPWSTEDVAHILRFLSWHEPLQGAAPGEERQGEIEAGRVLILDACAAALEELAEEAAGGPKA